MRVNRRFLYWGVFFAAIGGVLVLADLRAVDTSIIADALRLWPFAFVVIGLAIVFRRTRLSLPSGLLAAAVPGLILGGGFALIPRIAVDCGVGGSSPTVATQQGVFDGPAQISVTTGCGALEIGTAPGNGWQLQADDPSSRAPVIDASASTLSIDAGGRGWHDSGASHDTWRVTLPTSHIDALDIVVNAGLGDINLASAQVTNLDVTTNAAKTTVDLSEASVANIAGTVNAGVLAFRLAASADTVASIEVNAGSLRVCAPSGLGLAVHHTGVLSGLSVDGQHQDSRDWESPDYAAAAHHGDLDVNVNLGSVEINPIGGCK